MKKIFSFWPIGALLILIVLMFWEVFFPPSESWVLSRRDGDVSTLYFYWRAFGFRELQKGNIPFWNPYVFCGVPFAAYPESALFYPPNLLFMVLPLPSALNASFVLHVFLLAVFQFLFLRYLGLKAWASLLGALVLIFSAPVVLHVYAGHLSNICTVAWWPLLFLCLEGFIRHRRAIWLLGLGFFLGLQILAGHWQYSYYAVFFLLIYGLFHFLFDFRNRRAEGAKWLGGMMLFLAVGVGLAALQLLPALELSRDSFRKALDYEWAANFSLPPLNLLTFLIPGILGDTVQSLYWGRFYFWEMCAYLGFIPLLLALSAVRFRRDRSSFYFFSLALIAVVLALGENTPLYRWFYRLVPGFRFFRGSSKFLFPAVFSLSVLAARGADSLDRWFKTGEKKKHIAVSGLLLCLAIFAFFFPTRQRENPPAWWQSQLQGELLRGRHYDIVPPGEPLWWQELVKNTPPDSDYRLYVRKLVGETPFPRNSWAAWRRGWLRLGVFSLAFSLLLAGEALFRRRCPVGTALLFGLVAGELISWSRPFIVGFDSRVCEWDRKETAFFSGQLEPFRYLSLDPADFNRGMLRGYPAVVGYQADLNQRYLEYINVSQGNPPHPDELLPLIRNYSHLLDLINMKYVIGPEEWEMGHPGFERATSGEGRQIWVNRRALPRVLISPRAKVVGDRLQILQELNRRDYRPQDYIILEEDIDSPLAPGGEGGARIAEYDVNRVLIEAELTAPAFLLLNDSYSPGWKAFVDGEETELFRANYLMRAVFLPEGRHSVLFLYLPPAFSRGVVISFSTVVLLIVAIGLLIGRGRGRFRAG